MEMTSQSSAKLIEVQALAKSYDQKLRQEFGDNVFGMGGTLFLGKHYAESDKIFFALTPGTWKAEHRKQFEWWLHDVNHPWEHPDPKFRYWGNCSYFFAKSPSGHISSASFQSSKQQNSLRYLCFVVSEGHLRPSSIWKS